MPKKSYTPEEYDSAVEKILLKYAEYHLSSAVFELKKSSLAEFVPQLEKILKKVKAARRKVGV